MRVSILVGLMVFVFLAYFLISNSFSPLLQPLPSCSSLTCSLSHADGQCLDDTQCVIASCEPGYCDSNGLVADGCEFVCASQNALSLNLAETFAPVGSTSPGQVTVTFLPNSLDPAQGVYLFSYYENGFLGATYSIDTSDFNLQKGAIDVYSSLYGFYVISDGGVKKRIDGIVRSPLEIAQMVNTYTFSHQLFGNVLKLSFGQTISTSSGIQNSGLTYFVELHGKTLIMRIHENLPSGSSSNNYYRGWTSNCASGTSNPVNFDIPYMEQVPITRSGTFGNEFFYSTYYDRSRSGSNAPGQRISGNCGSNTFRNSYDSTYTTLQSTPSGTIGVLPFEETVYVTVSSDVNDVMVSVHSPPSSARSLISNKVFFDYWRRETTSQLPGTTSYAKTSYLVQALYNYGLSELFFVDHFEQKNHRDCGYPDLLPPNNELVGSIPMGGSSGLNSLIETSTSLGILFGMDLTFDMMHYQHPNNLYADPSALIKSQSGAYVLAWNNQGCILSPNGYTIAVNKKLQFVKAMASVALAEGYAFTGLFIDVTTAKDLAASVDYSHDNVYGRTLQQVYRNLKLVHKLERQVFANGGPVAGEGHKGDGSATFYFVEEVTATEGELENGENALVIPDFDLRQIAPHQVRQGMGYAGRWIVASLIPWQVNYLHPNEQYTTFPNGLQNVNFDKYIATSLAFGHSGMLQTATFGANNNIGNPNYAGVPSPTLNDFINRWVEDYYLFQAIQSLYLSSSVSSIEYLSGSTFIDLNTALKTPNFDFLNVRLKIVYANGLVLYVNRHQVLDWNVSVDGVTYYLPANGWIAVHTPSNFIQYSARVDSNGQSSPTGTRADYVRSNDYIFVDARGNIITFPTYGSQSVTTSGVVVHRQSGAWQLSEQTDGTFVVGVSSQIPAAPSGLTALFL